MVKFVHLHCHTDYSLYDGFMSPESLAERVALLDQKAVAITDHGKVAGFIKFSKACKKYGIKPIFGVEMYMSHDLSIKKIKRYHIIILAKNNEGLKNIYKLVSIGHKNTAYNFPRIDFDILKKHKDGLIITTACIAGEFSQMIIDDKVEEAFVFAKKCKEVWGDDFYLEINYTGLEDQKKVIPYILKCGKELGIKVIATNDCHYVSKNDAKFQQYKKSISIGRPIADNERDPNEYYVKSYEEMSKVFNGKKNWIECLHNTIEIADKCEAEIVFGQANLPLFNIPVSEEFEKFKNTQFSKTDEQSYLRFKSLEGLKEKELDTKSGYLQRLEDELETIRFTEFDRYFLIVSEYCDWARSQGVRLGAGRGSCVGSLVLYCLGVTGLDPIKYGLSMERFLYCEAEYRAGIGDFFSNQENPKWESQNRGCRTREKTEKEKDLEKRLINTCKKKISDIKISDTEKNRLKDELRFFTKNLTLIDDLMEVMKYKQSYQLNGDINRCNSYLFSLLGITDAKADLSKDFNFTFVVDRKQSRISPPDIDIDFEQRDTILQHLCKIYGEDRVALIGTTNTYKPKASVQFAAKAADVTKTNNPDEKRFSSLNDQEGKRLSKMMINIPNVTLSQWLGEDSNFTPPNKKVQEGMDELKKEKEKHPHVFELAKKLEGRIKAYGTHAAGVVISSGNITDTVPLHVAKVQRESILDSGMGWDDEVLIKDLFTTQYDMDEVESLGLLKFDFLQLNNLRQISLTLDLIKKRYGNLDFDIDNLETNDDNVFKTINDMKLEGLFQISGDAFVGKDWHRNDKVTGEKLYKTDDDGKEILDEKGKKIPLIWHNKGVMEIIGCSNFNDIVASNALGRPGPLACDMPRRYARGKADIDNIKYPQEKLREILEPTYGEMIFQEQLIKMAQVLAGFTFSEADALRKACAKKKAEMLNDIEPKFREGCKKNNIPVGVVDAMWTIAVEFGAYAFNESHCLSEDTLLFDKKTKEFIKVKDVCPGVVLDSYMYGNIVGDVVDELIYSGVQDVYEVELSNGQKIECTLEHEFLCSNREYKTIKEINEKDDCDLICYDIYNIRQYEYGKCKILSIKKVGKKHTYNISMKSRQHNYAVFGECGSNFVISKNSTAYGYITYQTAYLKTYYTAEFLSALLTSAAMQSDEKLETVATNLKKEYHGLTIIPPDVNLSEKTYTPSKNSGKRKIELIAPFMSIKGVGNKFSDAIVDVRNSGLGTYASVDHFFRAVNSSGKTTISNAIAEILVKIGSFKSFGSEKEIEQEILMYQSLKKRVAKGKKRYADPMLAADPLF